MPMPMQPPGMGGGPPPPGGGGVNAMAAQDMAGRMGGPPPGAGGGDATGQVEQLLQQALMLTIQAGPEAFVMSGLGEVWKGVFATLEQSIRPQGAGGPQGPGPGGPGMPPGPPGGMAPPPGPQMSGPMG